MRWGEIFTNLFPETTIRSGGDKMCAKQIYRNLLIALLFLAFLSTASYLSATNRGIQVISKKGQPVYLYKDYHAVVIGVSDYEHWPKLPNAVKDAQEVAETLKRLGFEVELVTNPNYQQLRKVLNELTYKYGREQNRALLFYYAGHGETETMADGTKLGYIIPGDCPLLREDPQGFVNRSISMKDIEAYSLRIRSKHLLMLFDSCFSGSLFSMVRAVPEDISEKSSQPVRQYITAGTEEEQVPDQSLFKRSLLVGLKGDADLTGDGYITGSELGMYLSSKVVKYTKGKQHPQYGKINNPELDRGDFVFVPNASRKKRLESEKQKLAYIPKTVKSARVSLRAEPQERLMTDYIKYMVKRYDFFENNWNISGSFDNDFVDNGDRTVTDRATGLMWQRSGSSRSVTWTKAKVYIDKINRNQFAGYSDWRLPTIDELASLLEKSKKEGSHIDPVFDRKQVRCWSSDISPDQLYGSHGLLVTWIGNFSNGRIIEAKYPDQFSTNQKFLENYTILRSNHVRLIRSLTR
jgi:uncharacterized caspase-like protein